MRFFGIRIFLHRDCSEGNTKRFCSCGVNAGRKYRSFRPVIMMPWCHCHATARKAEQDAVLKNMVIKCTVRVCAGMRLAGFVWGSGALCDRQISRSAELYGGRWMHVPRHREQLRLSSRTEPFLNTKPFSTSLIELYKFMQTDWKNFFFWTATEIFAPNERRQIWFGKIFTKTWKMFVLANVSTNGQDPFWFLRVFMILL